MKIYWLLFAFVSAVWGYSTSSNLGQVSDRNFKEEVVESGKYVFVDFYADWCRHCKGLMPVIEELADLFEPYSDLVKIVKINGDKDGKRMAKKHAYQGYPTMKLFHGSDEPIEYDGARDLQSISNFIQQITKIRLAGDDILNKEKIFEAQKAEESKTKILRLNDFNFNQTVLETTKKTLLIFSATWCPNCAKLQPIIEELANVVYVNENNFQIGKIELDTEPGEEIADRYNIKALPTILYIDPVKGETQVMKGDNSLKPLVSRINKIAGLHRDVEGQLALEAGRILAFDKVVQQKLANSDKTMAGLELLDELHNHQDNDMVSYYKKLVNKVINGETQFFPRELERLNQILTNDIDKLQPETIDSMKKRSNILQVFI